MRKVIYSAFISFLELFKYILFEKKADVVLNSPCHFNRAQNGGNPYFEPLTRICKKNGLTVKLFEESGFNSNERSNPAALKFDLIVLIQIIAHKIASRFNNQYSQDKVDACIAWIFRFITFGKFDRTTVVTISNSNIRFWSSLNRKGRVYDLQHGIIYNGHPGYFNETGSLYGVLKRPNVKVLLWGSLYKKTIVNRPHDFDVDDKFIVVGYPMYREIEVADSDKKKRIMVSLQFTSDIDADTSAGMMDMLAEFIEEAVSQGYEVLMKHHPRFADEVDMAPLLEKYAGRVSLTTRPLDELASEVKLHVTWGSTTTMEYAAYGVPTIFLRDRRFDWASDMFYGQYAYPLYDGMTAKEVLTRAEDQDAYAQDCKTVKEWYESAYSPLNEGLLLKILKGDIDEK